MCGVALGKMVKNGKNRVKMVKNELKIGFLRGKMVKNGQKGVK
jgi:hypothetical protein